MIELATIGAGTFGRQVEDPRDEYEWVPVRPRPLIFDAPTLLEAAPLVTTSAWARFTGRAS